MFLPNIFKRLSDYCNFFIKLCVYLWFKRNNAICIATGYQLDGRGIGYWVRYGQNFSFFTSSKTHCRTHPAYYRMGATGPLPGRWVGVEATKAWSYRLPLVPRSRICGSIHPLSHTCSWCNIYLVNHRDYISIYLWLYGPLLDFGFSFSLLIAYTDDTTPWTGDQSVARSLPTRRATQTQNKHIPNIHASSGIWTQDLSVRAKTVRSLDHAATVICQRQLYLAFLRAE
jgi:hypothetical protein